MTSDFTWVETPNNPADPLLDAAQEVLEFQAGKQVDRIIVDVGTGNEECAWRDGAFRGMYAAQSSMDGSRNVRLFRAGGWPAPPKVIPKVASAGGPVTALQPLNGSPFAGWILDSNGTHGDAIDLTDRLGTPAHNATSDRASMLAAYRIPAPVAPYKAVMSAGQYTNYRRYSAPLDSTAAALNGFTFCWWMQWTGPSPLPNGYTDSWPLGWYNDSYVWMPWFIQQGSYAAPSGRVGYYHDGSPAQTILTDLYMTPGKWSFCSVSVDLSGNLIIGLDGVYETHTGVTMGSMSITSLGVLAATFSDPQYARQFAGASFDMLSWLGAKSQAFQETQRLAATGL